MQAEVVLTFDSSDVSSRSWNRSAVAGFLEGSLKNIFSIHILFPNSIIWPAVHASEGRRQCAINPWGVSLWAVGLKGVSRCWASRWAGMRLVSAALRRRKQDGRARMVRGLDGSGSGEGSSWRRGLPRDGLWGRGSGGEAAAGACASLRRAFQKSRPAQREAWALRALSTDAALLGCLPVRVNSTSRGIRPGSTPLSSRPAGGGRHGSLLAPVPLAPHHRPSRRSEGCPGLLRGAGEPRGAGDDATLTGHRVPGERGQLSGLIRRHLLVRSADAWALAKFPSSPGNCKLEASFLSRVSKPRGRVLKPCAAEWRRLESESRLPPPPPPPPRDLGRVLPIGIVFTCACRGPAVCFTGWS